MASPDLEGGADNLKQLCEVDADIKGAEFSVHKFAATDSSMEFWKGWAKSPEEAMRLWHIAVLMSFQLFDQWSFELVGKGTHPHPAVRMMTMLMGLSASIALPRIGSLLEASRALVASYNDRFYAEKAIAPIA